MADQQRGLTRSEGGQQRQPAKASHPLFDLRNEIDTLFDRFFSGSAFGPFVGFAEPQLLHQRFGGLMPKVDVSETERDIQIVAELPGLKQEDVELNLENDLLTLRGEAGSVRDEKDKQYHLTERSYGRFERSFRLPETVDRDKISASYENGLLTVTLPKSERARQHAKRIKIGGGK
jgi:HSP20 family protein